MDSIDRIMGFVMPFLPANLSEKQECLRSLLSGNGISRSLSSSIKTRENIKIRIEMAEKISDRVSKSNREAMLREQLKMIPGRAWRERRGTGDAGYREKVESSKMPDDIRKKALAEVRKLETGGSQNHESSVIGII